VAIPDAALTLTPVPPLYVAFVETPGPAKVMIVAPRPTISEYPVDGLVVAIPTPLTIF